ncbi:hypothetical protein SMALA_1236 [Streptomyces malaysiensis subsp. malaysiensis]|nr:hypothetical protein SMALA_1236 [Streptomyces malaysiensis]
MDAVLESLRCSVAPTAQVSTPHSGPGPGHPRHWRPPAAVCPVRRRAVRRLPGRPLVGRAPAPGARREEPGVEELVVRVDAEFAVRPEGPGGAPVATAENDGQTGGHDRPGFGHRVTPIPVRGPQRKRARRTCATRDGSALRRSHMVYNGMSLAE